MDKELVSGKTILEKRGKRRLIESKILTVGIEEISEKVMANLDLETPNQKRKTIYVAEILEQTGVNRSALAT